MNQKSTWRLIWLGTLLGLFLLVADVWAWNVLQSAHAGALRAQTDLEACGALASRIEQLRGKPNRVSSKELQSAELATRVERAAAAAEISPNAVLRISPEQMRRIPDSNYGEKSTQVQLRAVSLRQFFRFLFELTSREADLQTKSVRLSAPREQELGSQWNADATISYLVSMPQTSDSSSRIQP